MVIKNRLFPYPVLCGESDDYSSSTNFTLTPNVQNKLHELIIQYDFQVDCNALENLLRKGEAEYVLHVECGTTAYRLAVKSEVPHIEFRLPKQRVSGEINLVAMLVAKVDISGYTSQDLNEDYAGMSISFKKGSILAYQNLPPIFVSKKTEELANNESFITVVRKAGLDPDEVKPLEFNLSGDKIQVFVDERTYEAYIRYQHTGAIAMAMLVLPALIYMVNEVGENPEAYERYQWFQQLERFYRAHGQDFVEDVLRKEDNPVNIAQEMLQNPVSKAYRGMYALEEYK